PAKSALQSARHARKRVALAARPPVSNAPDVSAPVRSRRRAIPAFLPIWQPRPVLEALPRVRYHPPNEPPRPAAPDDRPAHRRLACVGFPRLQQHTRPPPALAQDAPD